MCCDLGAVPVHGLPAAGHPAVDGLLAPGGVVGEVLPLVDRGRHVADLVVAPELGTVWIENVTILVHMIILKSVLHSVSCIWDKEYGVKIKIIGHVVQRCSFACRKPYVHINFKGPS